MKTTRKITRILNTSENNISYNLNPGTRSMSGRQIDSKTYKQQIKKNIRYFFK